jgi:hypothetical protein
VIVFNEGVAWDDRLLKIEPPIAATTAVETTPNGATAVRIKPPGRWENSTRYAIRIDGAVEDLYGTQGRGVRDGVCDRGAAQGNGSGASGREPAGGICDSGRLREDVDRAAVEGAFRIEPSRAGVRVAERADAGLAAAGLRHSTTYASGRG